MEIRYMKVVILAGGFGTRISEESVRRPKPMVEIGGKPILWHVMKLYSHFGLNEFIICLGYKGHIIKEYFANCSEPWNVTLVETGEETSTGGRLKKVQNHLMDYSFCFTYGDGLAHIDISEEVKFHDHHGKIATILAVYYPSQYGIIKHQDGLITSFVEKPQSEERWINGGFFVLSPKVFKYINENESFEADVLPRLARERELMAFEHKKFWHSMDTIRDKKYLDSLYHEGDPLWSH